MHRPGRTGRSSTEGSFNSPASGIKAFELDGRECVGRQIGNDGFKGIPGEAEVNNTERKLIKRARIMAAVYGGKIIKNRVRREVFVMIGMG